MQRKEFAAHQLSDLQDVASFVIDCLPSNPIILLSGPMGAGKTAFVQAICRALGLPDAVSSPTYALINEYQIPNGPVVWHADLYRVSSLDEALDTGIMEYLDGPGYGFVEWPEVLAPVLDESFAQVIIEYSGQDSTRNIVFLYNWPSKC